MLADRQAGGHHNTPLNCQGRSGAGAVVIMAQSGQCSEVSALPEYRLTCVPVSASPARHSSPATSTHCFIDIVLVLIPPGTHPPVVSPKALSLVHYYSSGTPLLSVASFPLVP